MNGRLGISFYSVSDQERIALTVLKNISNASSEVACRSALIAARIASHLRSQRLSLAIRQALENFPSSDFSPRLRAMRDLALAMSVHYTDEPQLSLSILRKCVDNLRDLADSTAVSLYSGIGASCSRLGGYTLGKQASQQAVAMAQRLGNDLLASTAYGNLAVQSFRLGEYVQAREYASRAYNLSLFQATALFDRIRGSYFLGMSEAFGCLSGDDTPIHNLAGAALAAERPWNRQFASLPGGFTPGARTSSLSDQGSQARNRNVQSTISAISVRNVCALARNSECDREGP
jgi:hypothetical protein